MKSTGENTNYRQQLKIVNSNFSDNFDNADAIIIMQSNTKLIIEDSEFKSNVALSRGCIFLADYKRAEAEVFRSNFSDNYSKRGGILFAHFYSNTYFENSIIENNTALEGGVGAIEQSG